MNALWVYDDKLIKTKVRTYGDKIYTNFRGLIVLEDDIECESFTVISVKSLFVYKNKYYQQVYLYNCTYKVEDKGMIDCLGGNPFEADEDEVDDWWSF